MPWPVSGRRTAKPAVSDRASHRAADGVQGAPRARRGNAVGERSLCGLHEALRQRRPRRDDHRDRGVRHVAAELGRDVERDGVAGREPAGSRHAVHGLVVDADADRAREAVHERGRRAGAVALQHGQRDRIELRRGHAGLDGAPRLGQGERHDAAGALQPLQIGLRLDRHAWSIGERSPSIGVLRVPLSADATCGLPAMEPKAETQHALAAATWLRRASACLRPDCTDCGLGRVRSRRKPDHRPPERFVAGSRDLVGRSQRGGDHRADRHRPADAPAAPARRAAEARPRLSRRGAFALPDGAGRGHDRRARGTTRAVRARAPRRRRPSRPRSACSATSRS